MLDFKLAMFDIRFQFVLYNIRSLLTSALPTLVLHPMMTNQQETAMDMRVIKLEPLPQRTA